MRRSWSGVEWYSKNCVILNIHPVGSEPSKRDTSSFRRGKVSDGDCGEWLEEEDGGVHGTE